jgi:prophage regulatory protein
MRILSKKELRALVLYSPAHIDRLEKAGLFPKRVHLGPCRVGWIESEVLDWLQKRIDLRDRGSRSKEGPSAPHNSPDH